MIITERNDQSRRKPSGEYVRVVEINANHDEVLAGVGTDDYAGGSTLLDGDTWEVYNLVEHTDGTKAWVKS